MRRLRIKNFLAFLLTLLLFLSFEGCATYLGARLGGAFDEAAATTAAESIPLDSLTQLDRGDNVLIETSDHGQVRGYVDMIRRNEFIVVCSDTKEKPEWVDQIEWSTITSAHRLHNHHVMETIGVFSGFAVDMVLVKLVITYAVFFLAFGF